MSVLVSLEHADGITSVRREGHEVWLGHTLVDRRFGYEGITGGLVVGGLLPPGAARAVFEGAPARVGGGAWLAVTPNRWITPAVRFENAAGEVVRPALPADWAVEPVPDADTPCPACGAATWERATPTGDDRAMHGSDELGWTPTPIVVCVRCGHEEREGVWYASDDDGSVAAPYAAERVRAEHRAAAFAALAATDAIAYALADARVPPALGGWSLAGDELRSVSVRHGELAEITADRDRFDRPHEAARDALRAGLPGFGEPPEVSIPALTVWLAAREREQHSRVAAAEPFAAEVPVDGRPMRFEAVRAGPAWAAAADAGDVRIVIAARDLAPLDVALRRIDPRTLAWD